MRSATLPPECWLIEIYPTGCTCVNTQIGGMRRASEELKHSSECEQRD